MNSLFMKEPDQSALQAAPPPRTKKARARKPAAPPDPSKPRTADIAKIVNYYLQNVRNHDRSEYRGIFRQILLMLGKGITLAEVSQAVQNYEKDAFTQANPPQRRHHIRRFMMPERIRQWSTTTATKTTTATGRDQSLTALDRLTREAIANQAPPPPTPIWKVEEEDEDECSTEL